MIYFQQSFAQRGRDSIPPLDTTEVKIRAFVNLDGHLSMLNDDVVWISGLKGGVQLHGKARFGVGYYFQSTGITKRIKIDNVVSQVDAKLRFNYFALYGEYIALKTRTWEVSFPCQYGVGKLYYIYDNQVPNGIDKVRGNEKKLLNLVEGGVIAQYRMLSWLGLGLGMGYRQLLSTSDRLQYDLNAPTLYIKAKIYPKVFYNQFLNKANKKSKEDE